MPQDTNINIQNFSSISHGESEHKSKQKNKKKRTRFFLKIREKTFFDVFFYINAQEKNIPKMFSSFFFFIPPKNNIKTHKKKNTNYDSFYKTNIYFYRKIKNNLLFFFLSFLSFLFQTMKKNVPVHCRNNILGAPTNTPQTINTNNPYQ